jgi:hypothetical protein
MELRRLSQCYTVTRETTGGCAEPGTLLTTMRSTLQAVGALLLELVVFGLGLLAALWAANWLPAAWQQHSWSLAVPLTGIYFALGTIPLPLGRRSVLIAAAAFLVPLWIIGWISWRLEYFLMFEHVGAWENLPRVILDPENLFFAALVCAASVLGQRLASFLKARTTANAV